MAGEPVRYRHEQHPCDREYQEDKSDPDYRPPDGPRQVAQRVSTCKTLGV
jgi:hypothetical protein